MTIRAQLRLLLTGMGVLCLLILAIQVRAGQLIRQEQQRVSLLNDLMRRSFDLNLVTNDYLTSHSDRAMQQMQTSMGRISDVFARIQGDAEGRLQLPPIMDQNLAFARALLAQIRIRHERVQVIYGVDLTESVDPFLHQQVSDLASDLSISVATLVNQAQNQLQASIARQARVVKASNLTMMGSVVGSFLLLLLAVMAFGRNLRLSLEDLRAGTARIAAGDLRTRLPITGRDELADLTRSVNRMTEQLETSYDSQQQQQNQIQRLNQDLESQVRNLDQANKEMESFTYTVSHDLRAPLRHLMGFVELLERRDTTGLDEKSHHYLEVISGAARKMGCLIDDLLSFSRMGRGDLMARKVDLAQLTAEVIQELADRLPPERRIQWQVASLPTVIGDHAMLRLVLVNLLANAIKYSVHRDPSVIEVGPGPSEPGCQVFYVRDNGAGFDMKYVDKLFGLFQRLHSSQEYEGTGVGLASVRRIIARHGGRTWAESELDHGATFYFTLPFSEETT